MAKGRPPVIRTEPLVTMSIRIPESLHAELKTLAAEEGRSACQETIKAIESYIAVKATVAERLGRFKR